MRAEPDSEIQAAVRSWYLAAATLSATVVLLVATGWHTPFLRRAAVPAIAAAALAWSEGRRRHRLQAPGPATAMALAWLAVLVIATGVVALYGLATSW
jgi:hypothetical protein